MEATSPYLNREPRRLLDVAVASLHTDLQCALKFAIKARLGQLAERLRHMDDLRLVKIHVGLVSDCLELSKKLRVQL